MMIAIAVAAGLLAGPSAPDPTPRTVTGGRYTGRCFYDHCDGLIWDHAREISVSVNGAPLRLLSPELDRYFPPRAYENLRSGHTDLVCDGGACESQGEPDDQGFQRAALLLSQRLQLGDARTLSFDFTVYGYALLACGAARPEGRACVVVEEAPLGGDVGERAVRWAAHQTPPEGLDRDSEGRILWPVEAPMPYVPVHPPEPLPRRILRPSPELPTQ